MQSRDELEKRVSELERQLAGLQGVAGMPFRGIRKRSSAAIGDLPFYDIAVGPDPTRGEIRGHAKGVVAIGDMATGVLAIGGLARGVVALGGLAAGLFSLGGLSIGLLVAAGGLAIGSLAGGGAAVGGIAVGSGAAGYYACGGGALATSRSMRVTKIRRPRSSSARLGCRRCVEVGSLAVGGETQNHDGAAQQPDAADEVGALRGRLAPPPQLIQVFDGRGEGEGHRIREDG